MYNIILILMLLSIIYNYIFKRNVRSNLNCGIFAWTGVSSDKFSPFLFNVLGTYNDNRGGDSCGVYFNKGSILGIKTEAKYETLVKNYKLHTTIKLGKNPIAIGHCRKASVGTVSESNVQPVLLRNAEKDDKLVYVQAHNGTITNHRDLAKKYNVEVGTDDSDSLVMSRLIAKEGFKILGEYEGSAALIMYFTKEPNTLYAFHGQSKNYTTVTEERPLHYINIEGSGTYISSEANPLEFIANGAKASSFTHNIVYRLKGDAVEEVQKIDREKAVLKKYQEVVYPEKSHANNTSDNWKGTWLANKNTDKTTKALDYLITKGITKNICDSTIDSAYNNMPLISRIRYFKGFYHVGTSYANGEIICDPWGYLRDPSLHSHTSKTALSYLYFFYGILLCNKESYDVIAKKAKEEKITSAKELYDQINFNKMDDLFKLHALFPFTRLTDNPGVGYMKPTKAWPALNAGSSTTFYTGEFSPIFSDFTVYFSAGDFVGYRRKSALYNISDLIDEFPEFEEHLNFGKSPLEIKSSVITSCSDCQQRYPRITAQDCIMCTTAFGEDTEPKKDATQNKVRKNCMNCGDYSCSFNGDSDIDMAIPCETWCSIEEGKDQNEHKIAIYQTIADSLPAIIDDIDDLIKDIEYSGNEVYVKDELLSLNDANIKLKNILQ